LVNKDQLDERGAIRERLSVGKSELSGFAGLVGAAMCSAC